MGKNLESEIPGPRAEKWDSADRLCLARQLTEKDRQRSLSSEHTQVPILDYY